MSAIPVVASITVAIKASMIALPVRGFLARIVRPAGERVDMERGISDHASVGIDGRRRHHCGARDLK